jgi:hypothetical protein
MKALTGYKLSKTKYCVEFKATNLKELRFAATKDR